MRLYRAIKVDPADGKPRVGTGSMMLGVRPEDPAAPNKRADVLAVAPTDPVYPGGGGLSCYTDPAAITIQLGKLVVWSVDAGHLPPDLNARPARPPHYHIEPSRPMTLAEFQQFLAATRDSWQRV